MNFEKIQFCLNSLYLSGERLATLGACPKVDPVVELGQLGHAVPVPPGVDGTVLGQPEARELGHHRQPSLVNQPSK